MTQPDDASVLPEDWSAIQPLLDRLLDAVPAVRPALLDELCAGNAERRAQLARLLAECERDLPLLDIPAIERFDRLVADEETLVLPEVLGARYRIVREIGRGGMARVYLAADLKHTRDVAVKVIRPELAESMGRDRFLREIAIAARLRHPNIMPLFDSGDVDGLLYFVMPYEDGPSLRTRLASGKRFTVPDALNMLREVAKALAYAHEQGVVHRDVKPDNIMLSGGTAVVSDFGIAKAVSVAQATSGGDGLTQSGVGMGTPAYMAPEQAVGDPTTDHRADIYAFGCVAYEVLVGAPPFVGESNHAVIAAHLTTTPASIASVRPDVPDAISDLIARCLAKRPESRPQQASALVDGLVMTAAPAVPATAGFAATPTRNRVLIAAAVVGLIAVAAISTNAFLSRSHAPTTAATPKDAANVARQSLAPEGAAPVAAADSTRTAPATRTLVVLPMENRTGDAKDGYVAEGLAEDIAKRLEGIGGIRVRSGARSEWPTATRHDIETVASTFGSTIVLKTVLEKRGDSLEVSASVVNLSTFAENSLAKRRFTTAELLDVESDVAARIAGALFATALPADPHPSLTPPSPESYRLMLEGFHSLLTLRQGARAKELFQQATALDATNARAWSGLSSAWGMEMTAETVPYADGYEQAESAAKRAISLDSMQGTAWANLGFLRAGRYRSLKTGLDLIRKGIERDPGNPEVFLLEAALYRNAWRWDKSREAMRIAKRLDPISPFYANTEAANEMCAGQFAQALKLYGRVLERLPSDSAATVGSRRALAALGRYDDAIAQWRRSADPALLDRLARAKGAAGYWEAKHFEGRQRLQRLRDRAARGGYVSPRRLTLAEFAAGDIEAGFRGLEQLSSGDVELPFYRLPCMADVDEVRATPRFVTIQNRVGALPR